jgi:homoserine kinase
LPETLIVTAPATSANLGPGFDVLALALDLGNVVKVTRRPGPLEVRISGEGAGDVPEDASNLVCRAIASGLGALDGLVVACTNRIPLGRGLGSSAAAVCAGLVAANAIGGLRWTPDEMLGRAADFEGHADNAAACLEGGLVAVAPGPRAVRVPLPERLGFVVVIPEHGNSTEEARGNLPERVPLADASHTLSLGIGLVLALADGRLGDLPDLLRDRLHEPHRAACVPAIESLRALVDGERCLGATISGSGPSMLLWGFVERLEDLAAAAEAALTAEGAGGRVRISKPASTGVRARWSTSEHTRLERAIG